VSGATVGAGRPIVLRGFFEGIELPILSAQVTVQPNAPAQAVIQMPPAALGYQILERTVVHLFFLDSLESSASLLSYNGPTLKDRETRPTLYELSQQRNKERPMSKEEWDREQRNSRYKLLFAGEVMAVQEHQTATSRSLVFQCLDLTNYWDYAYQFNNTDLFGPGLKAILSGGATNLFTDFLSSPGEIVAGLLRLPSANYPSLKGPMGGLIRLIESIGGCYQQDTRFEGQNTFFSIAELRLRISQMLTAYPEDRTIARLLSGGSPDGIFGRSLGNLGEQVSIRTVFNAIAGILFLETFNIPSPLFVPGSNNDVRGRNPRILRNVPALQYVAIQALQGIAFAKEMSTYLGSTAAYANAKDQQREGQLAVRRVSHVRNQVQKTVQRARQDKSLRSAQNKRVLTRLGEALQKLSLVQSKMARWKPGVKTGSVVDSIKTELLNAQAIFDKILDMEVDLSDQKTRTPQRLNTAIVRPNVWFSAPPRCNVIWPHHLFSRSRSINFMAQPTRLLLKTHDEFFGEDELFDQYFFAPRARTMKGKRHKGTMAELFSREIMSHELLTGVIPVFTKMGEFNILALRSQDEAALKPKNRPKISLAQRTANFLYYQKRFAARGMSLECVFSPYLVAGFPGLVFDRYVEPEAVDAYQEALKKEGKATPELRQLLGSHYLGTFGQITHSISATQATTAIEVQYARQYAEATEALGPSISDDQVIVKRYETDAKKNYIVAALDKPKVGALGISYGIIEEVEDITEGVEGMVFSVYTGPRRVGDTSLDGQATVGQLVRLSDVSPTLAGRLGDKAVTFRAYRLREAIPRYRREKVDLPLEELIRPGWYDDVWRPSRIGQAYQHFFQIGSITDATQIGDPGSPSTPEARQHVRDRLAEELTGKTIGSPQDGVVDAILALDQDSSIEQAVDFLLAVFAYAKRGGLNEIKFTDAYTWRPIASLTDVFGTSDLEFDKDGIRTVRGVEGFHSRAFGPYRDLFGLVTEEVEKVLGADKVSKARKEGDVRGLRFDAVMNFREAVRQGVRKGPVGL
jgi:hypothetical protein